MKAFNFKENFEYFEYPEDLKQIYDYLTQKGTLNISLATLDDLYTDFCYNYYCDCWLTPEPFILKRFAEWLSEYEI